VVFSHSVGNDALMLAIYDDNRDGRADRDEVVVEGLSIDNNLFLHGLAVDSRGTVYVIEDASSTFDGAEGNGGIARIDAFPDPNLNGFLRDGSVFAQADFDDEALSGLGFAPPPHARKMIRKTWRTTGTGDESPIDPVIPVNEVPGATEIPVTPILVLQSPRVFTNSDDGESNSSDKRPECREAKKKSKLCWLKEKPE
jgi:hypothetical protein